MSDKDERKKAEESGKDTREEKLADQIEDRVKGKVENVDDIKTGGLHITRENRKKVLEPNVVY